DGSAVEMPAAAKRKSLNFIIFPYRLSRVSAFSPGVNLTVQPKNRENNHNDVSNAGVLRNILDLS
ncbi:MAG: hypothetical protein E7J78_03385, partial [Pantoea sp.]|nr:hypothetical protein [Pantoea sp.]